MLHEFPQMQELATLKYDVLMQLIQHKAFHQACFMAELRHAFFPYKTHDSIFYLFDVHRNVLDICHKWKKAEGQGNTKMIEKKLIKRKWKMINWFL